MRLDDVAFEILVEEIGGAHGPEADRVVHPLLAHLVEALAEIDQFHDVTWLERGRIGRHAHEQRLDELALAHDVARIAVIGLGIALGMPADLASQRVMVRIDGEMAAAAHQRAAAIIGDDLQPEFRQLQRPDDLRPQQAADIGAVGIGPAVMQHPADRRAADPVVALQHQHLEPGAGEIASRDQPVMAGSDDDGVVTLSGHDEARGKPLSCTAGRGRVRRAPLARSMALTRLTLIRLASLATFSRNAGEGIFGRLIPIFRYERGVRPCPRG